MEYASSNLILSGASNATVQRVGNKLFRKGFSRGFVYAKENDPEAFRFSRKGRSGLSSWIV